MPAWPELPTRRWWSRASCGSSEATSSTPPTITWSKRTYPRVLAARAFRAELNMSLLLGDRTHDTDCVSVKHVV